MTVLVRAGFLSLALLWLTCSGVLADHSAAGWRGWVDDSSPAIEFLDARLSAPETLLLIDGETQPVRLPFAFRRHGRTFRDARGTADGRLVLSGESAGLSSERMLLHVLGGATPGLDARVLYQEHPGAVTFRWIGFASSLGERLVFEAHLRRDGLVRFQYLEAPSPAGVRLDALDVAVEGPDGRRVAPIDGGVPDSELRLRNAAVIEFPVRDPARPHVVECPPAHGLPPDLDNHCTLSEVGLDRVPDSGDEVPDCVENANNGGIDATPCGEAVLQQWDFNEQSFCGNCPYVFYVRVDCGIDLFLPFDDPEAMQVSITDLHTGQVREITGENECFQRRDTADPFLYCADCFGTGALVAADDTPGGCDAGSSELPCLAYQETGTVLSWGKPAANPPRDPDVDGDGIISGPREVEAPPCDNCDDTTTPACRCPNTTGANQLTQDQLFDVILRGDPFLSGVYRVELLSGSFVWNFIANCNGSLVPDYFIYSDCASALMDYRPLPELSLSADATVDFFVDDESNCDPALPGTSSVRVGVTTCNLGATEAPSVPFVVSFDNGAAEFRGDNAMHPSDADCQAPLPVAQDADDDGVSDDADSDGLPDECRTCYYDMPLDDLGPATATLRVDDDLLVEECSEQVAGASCPFGSIREAELVVCVGPPCAITAAGSVTPDTICLGESTTIDGGASVITSCADPLYEFQVSDGLGGFTTIPGCELGASTTCDYTPTAPGPQQVFVRVACGMDPACESRSPGVELIVLPDGDSDGVSDACDNCPGTSNAGQEDADSDTVGDACDNCRDADNAGQEDADSDTVGDACDNCPNADNGGQEDADSDTVGDACDNCPDADNAGQEDADSDTVGDSCDNCPDTDNAGQEDADSDTVGDACDNCPDTGNTGQEDADSDTIGDSCDNCPDADDAGQEDADSDGAGDACDNCPDTSNAGQEDADSDTVGDLCDNCPDASNSDQQDVDSDGVGDACDSCPDDFNPIHDDPVDCNSDGMVDPTPGSGEGAGEQCSACACTGAPPEALALPLTTDHLTVVKGRDALELGSAQADGRPSTEFFGAAMSANVIDHYNAYRGTFPLGADGRPRMLGTLGPLPYDHAPFPSSCELTGGPVLDSEALNDGGQYYYLVAAECAADSREGPHGFQSDRITQIPAVTPCP